FPAGNERDELKAATDREEAEERAANDEAARNAVIELRLIVTGDDAPSARAGLDALAPLAKATLPPPTPEPAIAGIPDTPPTPAPATTPQPPPRPPGTNAPPT